MSGVIGAPANAPVLGDDRGGPATPLLGVNGLVKHFGKKAGFLTKAGAVVRAVDGVSFDVAKGETLGIVGESGCGKSTVARLIMQIIKPDDGELLFDGEAVGSAALDHHQLPQAGADDLPGQLCLAQSAPDGRGHGRLRAARAWHVARAIDHADARPAASRRARARPLCRPLSA